MANSAASRVFDSEIQGTLKTVVCSKRSDPRMGEQTFCLTNIVPHGAEPVVVHWAAGFQNRG
jgi:hypothetical protein